MRKCILAESQTSILCISNTFLLNCLKYLLWLFDHICEILSTTQAGATSVLSHPLSVDMTLN